MYKENGKNKIKYFFNKKNRFNTFFIESLLIMKDEYSFNELTFILLLLSVYKDREKIYTENDLSLLFKFFYSNFPNEMDDDLLFLRLNYLFYGVKIDGGKTKIIFDKEIKLKQRYSLNNDSIKLILGYSFDRLYSYFKNSKDNLYETRLFMAILYKMVILLGNNDFDKLNNIYKNKLEKNIDTELFVPLLKNRYFLYSVLCGINKGFFLSKSINKNLLPDITKESGLVANLNYSLLFNDKDHILIINNKFKLANKGFLGDYFNGKNINDNVISGITAKIKNNQ